jgi:hypothetical protein
MVGLEATRVPRHRPCKSHSDPPFGGEGDNEMSKLLRGVAAGWGAKKLGGGCFTTILVFILLWWLLGNFSIFQ